MTNELQQAYNAYVSSMKLKRKLPVPFDEFVRQRAVASQELIRHRKWPSRDDPNFWGPEADGFNNRHED